MIARTVSVWCRSASRFLLVLLLVWVSCKPPQMAGRMTASLNREQLDLHPRTLVFHEDSNTTRVYFDLKPNELLAMRSEGSSMTKRLRVRYELYPSMDAKSATDSGSYQILDSLTHTSNDRILSSFTLPFSYGKTGVLVMQLSDLNRKSDQVLLVKIDKTFPHSRQFYLPMNSDSTPLFSYRVANPQSVLLRWWRPLTKPVQSRVYRREFPLPLPPFSLKDPRPFDYYADSIFYAAPTSEGWLVLNIQQRGFYHLAADTSSREGLTLFSFGEGFPVVDEPSELARSVRFITTRQEYDEISGVNGQTLGLEGFWLRCSGSRDKAKSLMNTYYSRVETSNQYFTSYDQGWKSDRGLIFIVFGSPTSVSYDSNSETWTYGEDNSSRSVRFTFSKVENPFTDNDFMLNRSEIYKDTWLRMVDAWRQGRVMSDKP
jgi:GWxTD domain-containing protein